MLVLDLCCGLGGAGAAMRDRGWEAITLDIEEEFEPGVVADVRGWRWRGERPDLVWASPPCVEFSRESMPWSRTGRVPDLSIVEGCKRAIEAARPRYWVIENVRGAVPYLGEPAERHGPFYLWGHFPALGRVKLAYRKKESYSSMAAAERAKIPYALSLAMARAVEGQGELWSFCQRRGETTRAGGTENE